MRIFIILAVFIFLSARFVEAQMTFDEIPSTSAKFRSVSPKNGDLVMTRKQKWDRNVKNRQTIDKIECRTPSDCTFGMDCTFGQCWYFLE